MKYVARGVNVWFDDRIYAQCTRIEDAVRIAKLLNRAHDKGQRPIAKKKILVAKKKVRKKWSN